MKECSVCGNVKRPDGSCPVCNGGAQSIGSEARPSGRATRPSRARRRTSLRRRCLRPAICAPIKASVEHFKREIEAHLRGCKRCQKSAVVREVRRTQRVAACGYGLEFE
jgi:hypothetical protein